MVKTIIIVTTLLVLLTMETFSQQWNTTSSPVDVEVINLGGKPIYHIRATGCDSNEIGYSDYFNMNALFAFSDTMLVATRYDGSGTDTLAWVKFSGGLPMRYGTSVRDSAIFTLETNGALTMWDTIKVSSVRPYPEWRLDWGVKDLTVASSYDGVLDVWIIPKGTPYVNEEYFMKYFKFYK